MSPPPLPPQNGSNAPDAPIEQYDADAARDQARYAPHIIILRDFDRLEQAMSSNKTSAMEAALWNLFYTLAGIDTEDIELWDGMLAVAKMLEETSDTEHWVVKSHVVGPFKTILVSFMVRKGIMQMPKKGPPGKSTSWRAPNTPAIARRTQRPPNAGDASRGAEG